MFRFRTTHFLIITLISEHKNDSNSDLLSFLVLVSSTRNDSKSMDSTRSEWSGSYALSGRNLFTATFLHLEIKLRRFKGRLKVPAKFVWKRSMRILLHRVKGKRKAKIEVRIPFSFGRRKTENENGISNSVFPCRRKTVDTKVHAL